MFGKLTYAPHVLHILYSEKQFDEYGNFVEMKDTSRFHCRCRCDDAGVRDAITVNGEQFFPSYHIVCEKAVDNGAYVRVLDNGAVRAEGKVVRTNNSNYFKLHEAWI